MHKFPQALALGAVLILGTAVARAAAPPTPVPDAKPDLSAMSFLLGTWNCTSMVRGSKRPDTTTYTMDYDGHWIKAHDVAPPFDKFRTRAITTDTWLTYSSDAKKWVQTSVDNFGGYGVVTSPGFSGNMITWTTVLSPDGSTGTDVLTKVSSTETKDTFNGKDKNGKAMPSVTTTCMKK